MRNVFLRLFFSIVSITLIIVLIQAGMVFSMNERMAKEWSQAVYDSYLERVKTYVENEAPPDGWTLENIWPALLRAADDRVSGLLVRNNDGELVASFGKTSRGRLLPVPPGYDGNVPLAADSPGADRDQTNFPMDEGDGSCAVADNASKGEKTSDAIPPTNKMTVVDKGKDDPMIFPPDVRSQDVTGTVDLFYNGERLGSVDVLTFTPMTYKFTADLVKSYLATFLVTIPVSLVVSLLLGFFISRRHVRFSEQVSRALFELAEGRHNVLLPRTNTAGLKKMVSSISHLDQRLQDHERARQAWLCSISHDLNTPVTSMKLLLDGMSDGIFPIDAAHIRMVNKENCLLQERIQSVVTYSTLQSPDTVANIDRIDVLELVDAVLRSFSLDEAARVDVKVDVPVVSCDFSLFQIACKELVSNALAASSGHVQWRIHSDTVPQGKASSEEECLLEMDFINAGSLKNPQIDFFEPWTRGDLSRTASCGSGLGLPIVGQVMRLHEGSASITNLETADSAEPKILVRLVWPEKP